jgi:hypothetical protein
LYPSLAGKNPPNGEQLIKIIPMIFKDCPNRFRSVDGRTLFAIGFGVILLGRIIIHALLYQSGFNALTADDFGRIIIAAHWSQSPEPALGGYWLPFYSYLFGTLFWIIWDLLWAPRIVAIIFGLVSIVIMFLITEELTQNRRLGLIAAILLAINPAHIWLSSTPLPAVIHFTLVLAALYCLIRYLKYEIRYCLYAGGLLFFLANGVRFEAWIMALVFSLTLAIKLGYLYKVNTLSRTQMVDLTIGIFLPWILPTIWIIHSYVSTGEPLASIAAIRTYKMRWYGSNRSYLNYLTTFLKIDPFTTVLIPLGLFTFLRYGETRTVRLLYIAVTILSVGVFVILHGGQSEPPGNSIRYLSPYLFLTLPIAVYFLGYLGKRLSISNHTWIIAAVLVILLILVRQFHSTFNFTNDAASNGLAIGKKILEIRSEEPGDAERPVIIELSYWEYLAIHVGSNDITGIYYDREPDFEQRSSQSLLFTDFEAFQACMITHKPSHIILKTKELKNILKEQYQVQPSFSMNGYDFFTTSDFSTSSSTPTMSSCPEWFPATIYKDSE